MRNDLEEEFFAVEGRPAIPFPEVDYGPVIRDLELRYAALANTALILQAGNCDEKEIGAIAKKAATLHLAVSVLRSLRTMQQNRAAGH